MKITRELASCQLFHLLPECKLRIVPFGNDHFIRIKGLPD